MELVPSEEFLAWAATKEIAPDARYAPPRCLVYVPYREDSRFWEVPPEARRVPFFLAHVLAGLGDWSSCYVWPRGGLWRGAGSFGRPADLVQEQLLRGVGIVAGHAGAVRFEKTELPQVLATLFSQVIFGVAVADDVFLVPDHGRQIIQTDHHDAIHVEFADELSVRPFVEHMTNGGFSLPDELPDETFKRPKWME